jgi:hypothetical protein
MDPEIGITQIFSNEIKYIWSKPELCLENTKTNGKRLARKHDDETMNRDQVDVVVKRNRKAAGAIEER